MLSRAAHPPVSKMADLLDGLDASLQDFEPPASPTSMRHSSALPSEPATEDLEESDIGSAGGYSPPAWRRLGNGDRSSGSWKHPQNQQYPGRRRFVRAMPPGSDQGDDAEDDVVLEQAIRTRLPEGSQSPEKGPSPSPQRGQDATMRVDGMSPATGLDSRASPVPDNCELQET